MQARDLILAAGGVALIAGVLVAAPLIYKPAPAAAQLAAPVASAEDVEDGRVTLAKPDRTAGQPEVLSLLDVRKTMAFGDYIWNDKGVPPGQIWVRVDLSRQLISVFRAGHEIGTAVILYGGEGKDTPTGAFPVLQKAENYHSRTYDAPMPFMLRLTADGVAIHASHVRKGWATHGCIGVPDSFARRLYGEMKLGDQVYISGESPPPT